ncbi:U32 family peptidase C-terminal domain-containing protein [Endozoicomonas sp. SCSIO W0465]|uniref:U32 family peptidase C-terminal domain-containing protein n=1 Tax=Endozoicomonas sp. SCSIO W0465 TaxID=2918516 RepID=UPI0020755969|nr:U32 family peptidase C-terminal domain-containing protein [Endozoicomonas sp. SCSIO W0465]USE36624.1 U32 family peptidase C-terminal domain-containing protein [Endozoicomonas sp. SCSIO W0465]
MIYNAFRKLLAKYCQALPQEDSSLIYEISSLQYEKSHQNYETGNSRESKQQFVGEIVEFDDQQLTVEVKNRFELGDTMELMTPKGNYVFTLEHLENRRGERIDVAPGSGHFVKIPKPEGVLPNTHSLLVRNLP